MTDGSGPTTAITVQQRPGATPRCPHCRADVSALDATLLRAGGGVVFGFGKRYLYSCPSCRAVLGVSHRKGFWMG